MDIASGKPLRAGTSIAAAARVQTEFGAAVLDMQRLRRLGERLRQFGIESPEPEQVILIADILPAAFLATPLPGLEYLGAAAQRITGDLSLIDCPAVEGLSEAFIAGVEEYEIVIVDGDRGRIYTAPDAMTLARYQAPFRRSRRIFLGSAHLPARTTSDNRWISVLAPASTLPSITEAVDGGADGLLIPSENDYLGPEASFQTTAEQTAALQTLLSLVGGKPIFLQVPSERLALSALLRGAAFGSVSLILEEMGLRDELGRRLSEIEAVFEEEDIQFGVLPFEAGLSTGEDAPQPATLDCYAGAWILENAEAADMGNLMVLAGLAHRARKPLTLGLSEEGWSSGLDRALSVSADRVVVASRLIADVKDAIRAS